MLKLISKLIGGNKSEKDVKAIRTRLLYRSTNISNNINLSQMMISAQKPLEFKQRIKDYLKDIDAEIESKKQAAETLA